MIRRRLTVLAVAALAVALAVITAGFYLLLSIALEHDAGLVLQTRLEAALADVTVHAGKVAIADSPGDDTLDATTWVLGPEGQVLLEPAASAVPQGEVAALAGVARPTTRDLREGVRLLGAPLPNAESSAATVVVSVSLAPYETTEKAGVAAVLVLDVVTLVLLALLARWLVGSALRPVDEMTSRAKDWAVHDVDRRFAAPVGNDDEIGRLGATLNDLLGRLAASLRHERRLSDEIAHELRTPLARARMEAELAAGADDPTAWRDALLAIVDDVDELSRTVDTLMDSARLGSLGSEPGDVAGAVTSLVASVQHTVPVRVDLHEGAALAFVDPAVVRQILSPQLDNAQRHAATGVDVSVRRSGGWIEVTVADDGVGLADDELERAFLPGHHGHDSDGLGLGLALARRLARAAGGDVTAEAGPGGLFRTTLPAAPPEG